MYETFYERRLLVSAPLDTSGILFIFGENYNTLLASRETNILVHEIFENYYYSTEGDMSSITTTVLCDVEAANLVFSQEYLIFDTLPITVTDDGYTVIDYQNGNPVEIALKWQNLRSFENHITEQLLSWGQ